MLRKITQILPHIFVFAFVILNREGKDILAGMTFPIILWIILAIVGIIMVCFPNM